MLFGDNGILNKSKQSADVYEEENIAEQLNLAIADCDMAKLMENHEGNYFQYLQDKGFITIETSINSQKIKVSSREERTEDKGQKATVNTQKAIGKITKREYYVYENGELYVQNSDGEKFIAELWKVEKVSTSEETSTSDVANAPASWYGRTVNYKVSDTNVQSVLDSENITWKIFYADSSHIYLITSNFIPASVMPPTTNKDGTTGPAIKSAGQYSIDLTGFASRYSQAVREIGENVKYLNNSYFNGNEYTSEWDTMVIVAYLLDTNAWSTFSSDKTDFAIGGATIEMMMTSFSQKYNLINDEGAYKYQAKAFVDQGYSVSRDFGSSFVGIMPAEGGRIR